jgi:Ran GTPase-activating protein (RanGAP) involved in mRNA processing and transport
LLCLARGHRLRQYGAAAIAACLLTTPSAKCTSIDLSNNMLGDEGAAEVANLLREYAPLIKLDLSFNDIGDRGALALADALRANASLTSFSLHSSIPGSASSVKPRLTEIGLMAMARALETHPTLAVLDLRDNVVSTTLIGVLVQTLQRNPRIVKFNGSSAAVFLARNEL